MGFGDGWDIWCMVIITILIVILGFSEDCS
jgi:hypothetical protein